MRIDQFLVTVLAAALWPQGPVLQAQSPPVAYDTAATEAWRAARDRDLRSETGWLTVAGLAFLQPGRNTVGSGQHNRIVLPASAPVRAGAIVREGEYVWFEPASGCELRLNGKPLTSRARLTARDRITMGRVTLQLHSSGSRLGVRVRDADSALRQAFRGLRWFPIQPEWRIAARFEPYPSPRTIVVPNVLGDVEKLTVPGEIVFVWSGRVIRLQAAQSGRRLWIIFSDTLGGDETYRIRFLHTDAADANRAVTLDFNRAYNPPCAYNPFTTCPLPPSQNRLPIAIPAGERTYH